MYGTEAGEALQEDIADAWERFHQRYAKILGLKYGEALTAMIDDANMKLSEVE